MAVFEGAREIEIYASARARFGAPGAVARMLDDTVRGRALSDLERRVEEVGVGSR